jgi:3-dehydroquinate synthase
MIKTQIYHQAQENDLHDAILQNGYSKIVLVTDANTNGFCATKMRHLFKTLLFDFTITLPQGEENKNLENCQYFWQQLLRLNIDKNALLVVLGGGCLLDLVSFCASTYKRGIDFIHMPTTLLAMVDATYGGKNGVDFNDLKNAIGTFAPAKAIYINADFLNTLSERKLTSGCAEMIKHSLVYDMQLWHEMKLQKSYHYFISIEKILSSLDIKKQIVATDIFDKDKRQTLNFGHSIGHAIESFSLSTTAPLLHGEAIALGMLYELKLSEKLLHTDTIIFKELEILISTLFPNLTLNYKYEDLLQFIINDKKNNTTLKMSLLRNIGDCEVQVEVELNELKSIF